MKTRLIPNRNGLALLVLVLGAIGLVWLFSPKFCVSVTRYFLSGQVLADRHIVTGGALDQPSLHKLLFLACLSIVAVAPPLGIARWLVHEPPRGIRLAFRALSAPLFWLPSALLTGTLCAFLRYVGAMGFTPRRMGGILLTLTCLAAVGGMLRWTWNFRGQHTNARSL